MDEQEVSSAEADKEMKKKRNKGLEYITYILIRLAVLPPLWVYRVLTWPLVSFGSSGWAIRKTGILQRIWKNLEIVFSKKGSGEKRLLVRRIIREALINSYESGRLYRKSWLMRSVSAEGLSHLDGSLAQGKGVILFSAHLGNFTLILAYLRQYDYPVRNIGRDPSNLYLARYFEKVRLRAGIRHIPKNPIAKSVKESIAWLKAGKIISLPSDQYASQGVPVPFFGRSVLTPTGPAVFARRLGCAVLPVSVVRQGKKHLIRIEPPFQTVHSENADRDVRNNTAHLNLLIERWVRDYPEKWFGWFTRRFR